MLNQSPTTPNLMHQVKRMDVIRSTVVIGAIMLVIVFATHTMFNHYSQQVRMECETELSTLHRSYQHRLSRVVLNAHDQADKETHALKLYRTTSTQLHEETTARQTAERTIRQMSGRIDRLELETKQLRKQLEQAELTNTELKQQQATTNPLIDPLRLTPPPTILEPPSPLSTPKSTVTPPDMTQPVQLSGRIEVRPIDQLMRHHAEEKEKTARTATIINPMPSTTNSILLDPYRPAGPVITDDGASYPSTDPIQVKDRTIPILSPSLVAQPESTKVIATDVSKDSPLPPIIAAAAAVAAAANQAQSSASLTQSNGTNEPATGLPATTSTTTTGVPSSMASPLTLAQENDPELKQAELTIKQLEREEPTKQGELNHLVPSTTMATIPPASTDAPISPTVTTPPPPLPTQPSSIESSEPHLVSSVTDADGESVASSSSTRSAASDRSPNLKRARARRSNSIN